MAYNTVARRLPHANYVVKFSYHIKEKRGSRPSLATYQGRRKTHWSNKQRRSRADDVYISNNSIHLPVQGKVHRAGIYTYHADIYLYLVFDSNFKISYVLIGQKQDVVNVFLQYVIAHPRTLSARTMWQSYTIICNSQARNGDFRKEEDKTIFPLLFTM